MKFPDPEKAIDGLLAMGGDLSIQTLEQAYNHGCFPWFNEGDPIFWWHPDPRLILFPKDFKCSRSLFKTLKKDDWQIRFDSDFNAVINACATTPRDGQGGTWITDDMLEAYRRFHKAGFAHSVEVYWQERLVGGLYGVMIGSAIFGESMFSHRTDASKVALAHLVRHALHWQIDFIDCQMHTNHLVQLGAKNIPRSHFTRILKDAKVKPTPTWIYNPELNVTDIY